MTVVRWTDIAIADLVAIGEYITEDNPAAARAWLERLRRRAELVAEAPLGLVAIAGNRKSAAQSLEPIAGNPECVHARGAIAGESILRGRPFGAIAGNHGAGRRS